MEAANKIINIEKPDAAAIDEIECIEKSAFETDRLSRHSLRRLLGRPSAEFRAAVSKNKVIGYALLLLRRGSRVGRLYSLAVAGNHLGKGIGRQLLEAVENAARARGCDVMRLEVRVENDQAISLYRRSGYRIIGRRKAYYSDGTDALRLEKKLNSQPSQKEI